MVSGDRDLLQLARDDPVLVRVLYITVEESKTLHTELETVEGMQFDRGYVSAYMVTDTEKMEAVLNEPYILITDKKISAVQDLLPILEKVVRAASRC